MVFPRQTGAFDFGFGYDIGKVDGSEYYPEQGLVPGVAAWLVLLRLSRQPAEAPGMPLLTLFGEAKKYHAHAEEVYGLPGGELPQTEWKIQSVAQGRKWLAG
jgi:hypothetical protein